MVTGLAAGQSLAGWAKAVLAARAILPSRKARLLNAVIRVVSKKSEGANEPGVAEQAAKTRPI
jgi:hypothetical protein